MIHEVIHLKDHFPFLGEDGKDPRLTLYLPYNMVEMKRQDQLRPAVLICPGGGYHFNSEREAEVIALRFLPKGYNAFVLNYSIAPHHFPSQIREVAAAMELIYANAKAWNTDCSRIALMGFSAGGHLACHYANCYDIPEVREVFPESKAVNASILSYPVITGDPNHRHTGSFQNISGHSDVTEADIEKYSLQTKVTDRTPPTFLWHTAEDAVVPIKNSIWYAEALAEHKVPFELHIYPFGWHGLSTCDDETNAPLDPKIAHTASWMDDLMRWLKITL